MGGGSDRFGRTTNPGPPGPLPGPIAKLYGQIYGKWFMDVKKDSDLWLLRHDTTYASLTENGIPIPFIKPHVSELHSQTAKQRSQNCTGPMVSLIHGLPSFVPGGCTCMPDPVGVPDTQSVGTQGMANMQYMGRIKLPQLEYLNKPIELDHWANWFFHIFMDTMKTGICSAISQSTFPPAPEAAGAPSTEGCAPGALPPASDEVRAPFFAAKHKVLEAIEHAKAQLQQIVV